MIHSISILFLFVLASTSLFAQGEILNIDSLKRVNLEQRQLNESRKVKLDEAIKRIESSDLSDTEKDRILRPLLEEYNVNSYKELLFEYDSLLMEDQLKLDSIDLQIIRVDSLYQIVRQGVLVQKSIDSLKQETERLKSIMNNYLAEIESLKPNSPTSIDSANLYYYNFNDLKKTRFYVYNCPQDSTRSQYWKVSVNRRKNSLITEAFSSDFVQFERFEEGFDSLGTKLIDYDILNNESVINTTIEKDLVYLWKSSKPYVYQVLYNTEEGTIRFSKTRAYLRKDSIRVLGVMRDALIFKDEYQFNNVSRKELFNFDQYCYYARGIGFVKYERAIPIGDTDFEFINLELQSILTEKEWKKLTKRKTNNDN